MKIVIGLGNPGKQYEGTRHNVGWMVLDRLAERAGLTGHAKSRDAAATMRGRYKGLDLVLVKPMTYMNESGIAVRKVLARERAPLDDLLVVYDDFDLPLGKLRMRERGQRRHAQRHALDRRRAGHPEVRAAARGHRRAVASDAIEPRPDALRRGRAESARRGPRRRRGRGRGLGPRGREPGGQPLELLDARAVGAEPAEARTAATPATAPRRRRRATASCAPRPAGESCCAVADSTGVRIRGRTTRERRIAEQAAAQATERAAARAASADAAAAGTPRARLPNLRALTDLLATAARSARSPIAIARSSEGRVGQSLRHVTYAQMPHGAKSFLAAALARRERRAAGLDRARLGDRGARRRGARRRGSVTRARS